MLKDEDTARLFTREMAARNDDANNYGTALSSCSLGSLSKIAFSLVAT